MNQVFTVSASVHGTSKNGSSVLLKWQRSSCLFLATVGVNNALHVMDRHGVEVDNVDLGGPAAGMEWSPDGDILSIILESAPTVQFWDSAMRRASPPIDAGMKALQCLAWNTESNMLAIGTGKGNLLLFNRLSSKKIPIMGKHSKAIVSMAWNKDNVLACGSLDHTFSLTNLNGDTIFQMGIKGEPSRLQWSTMRTTKSESVDALSIVLSNKTLLFHTTSDPDTPIELAFQSKYGSIVTYSWFGDGKVMIGFSSGHVIVVSTNPNEIGQELFQSRNHKDSLNDLAISLGVGKVATCGDGSVKVHELSDLKDVYALLDVENERGNLETLEWSEDGGFLSVSTRTGVVTTFLSRLPVLGGACEAATVHLTGMCEMTVTDHVPVYNRTNSYKKDLPFEPAVVACGPMHWSAALNHQAIYYAGGWKKRPTMWDKGSTPENTEPGEQILQKEYISSVKKVTMNDTMACVLLSDGRVQVHSIVSSPKHPAFQRFFPDKEVQAIYPPDSDGYGITDIALMNEVLVYSMSVGVVHHYATEDWSLLNEIRHDKPVLAVFTQPHATKLIFKDAANDCFITDPVKEGVYQVPNISSKVEGFVWESASTSGKNVFVSWDDASISIHAYQPDTIKGPQCVTVGNLKLPFGLKPILFYERNIICQTPAGRLSSVALPTHEPLTPTGLNSLSEQGQGKALQAAYTLGLMKDIWDSINVITSRRAWTMFAESALNVLDIVTARRVYRQILHDAGMVMTLTHILDTTEDLLSLAGHVCVIFRDFDRAQDLFLRSVDPVQALWMRRDLMHWDQAINLASKLAPQEVTVVARECGARHESADKFVEALKMYEWALETSETFVGTEAAMEEHQILCSAGITRMTFKTGDLSRGLKMLNGVDDVKLLGDCASILEGIKMYAESGSLFERAGNWERAADVYIKGKLWQKVTPLLEKITSPKLFLQYAKAKEALRQYPEAAAAFERAKDYDSLVRIFVENLQEIDKAVNIVRHTRSRESARVISKFFQNRGDYKSVVEFCIMAGMQDEAFDLAQQNDVMEHFGNLVKNDARPELLKSISAHFESKNQLLLAGKYQLLAKDYSKALRLFVRCPVLDGENIELAIECVGFAKSDALTHELIDFLMGETDGVPKEAKYIFKLYMSLGAFRDAARTAVIIAREEQTLGNYRAAHDLLLDNFRQLRKNKAPVPSEMERMLMLVHSYVLVKTLIRADDHEKGARMLIRVANNISKFPAHVVPILTSTVIECYRAGFKRDAFEYASMLMRPEYRSQVDAKYRKKIEQIVRRPEHDNEAKIEEALSPCPYCNYKIAETTLDCIECRNHIPFCIATGRHMTIEGWSVCPSCDFPGIYPEFKALVATTRQCPMCSIALTPEEIKTVPNAVELLKGKEKADAEAAAANTASRASVSTLNALGASLSALESAATVSASERNLAEAKSKDAGAFPGGVFGTAPGKDVVGNYERAGAIV